jgi:hypothetical protein
MGLFASIRVMLFLAKTGGAHTLRNLLAGLSVKVGAYLDRNVLIAIDTFS